LTARCSADVVVVPPQLARLGITVDPYGGECPLPAQLAARVGILARESIREDYPARTARQISLVQPADAGEVCGERGSERLG
jgi:hypothetical protein